MVAAGKIRGRGSSRPYLVIRFGMIVCDTSLKLVFLITFSLSEGRASGLCQSLGQDSRVSGQGRGRCLNRGSGQRQGRGQGRDRAGNLNGG